MLSPLVGLWSCVVHCCPTGSSYYHWWAPKSEVFTLYIAALNQFEVTVKTDVVSVSYSQNVAVHLDNETECLQFSTMKISSQKNNYWQLKLNNMNVGVSL